MADFHLLHLELHLLHSPVQRFDLRGQPVRVTGLFLKSAPIRLDTAIGGVEWVYRTYLCSSDGNEGYVFDLLEPPGDLEPRRTVVSVEGVFFKMATYEGARGPVKAPLFLGRSLRLMSEK